MNPFSIAHLHGTPHGVVVAVHIPDNPEPVPEPVLASLPPAEADAARAQRGYAQVQFVGGRIALRAAAAQMGVNPPALLKTERGAPTMPAGFVGSVSHKRDLAVGMVARDHQGTLGVDLEDYGPPRMSIASRILRPLELEDVASLPESRRWTAVALRFSLKESIYKALDPYVKRYVGFEEAEVWPDLQGEARVSLHLAQGEGPFEVSARYHWFFGRILTSVRIIRG